MCEVTRDTRTADSLFFSRGTPCRARRWNLARSCDLWFGDSSGTGFSLSSCVQRVRYRAEGKVGRIAAWQRRTGKSACATQREKERWALRAKH